MQYRKFLNNSIALLESLVRYNLKIIFAGKFFYFLTAALVVFFSVTLVNLMNTDAQPSAANIFWLLLVPGVLLVFYPTSFGIQNDVDSRMIEILFGIPNYRYKVWLLRLMLIFAVTFAMVLLLALFSSFALAAVPILEMMYHLMFPIMFLGCAAFAISTIIRNGSGTAVVMVVAAMVCWLPRQFFHRHPEWDIFLNPFELPQNMNEALWAQIVADNRIYLLAGIIIALVYGVWNLQKREKFL